MTKTRSLAVDKNDESAISGETEWHGKHYKSNILPMVPFFYTPEKWSAPLIDLFKGGSAFLIASGPSFASVDKSLLAKPGVWTMTLNNAVRSFRGNAACIVDDPSRFVASLWLDPKIMKFVPTSHFRRPIWDNRTFTKPDGTADIRWSPMGVNVGDCPNVFGYQRNEKFHATRYLKEETINWGNNKKWGGGRSVMLASIRILYLMGFRRVYLVGVDFDMTEDNRYHFDEGRTESAVSGNMATYSKLIKWFSEAKPLFDREGFIIKNCNPQSGLRIFPFISVEEAVHNATIHLGNIEHERTRGMYSKYDDKLATWQQMQQQDMTDEQKTKLIDEQEARSRDDMAD